jgi:hypothetical protein
MEIPNLSEKERQRMNCEMFVGNNYSVIGFIMQKLGPKGLKEYTDQTTKKVAQQFKAMGKDDPMGFAMVQAISCKNLWGSDVDVIPNKDGSVTLDIKECANLRTALEFAKKGAPITKERHCDGCISGYFRPVSEKLGIKMEVEFTDKGCKMTFKK